MPRAADVWWDDLRQEAELPPPPPPAARSKAPVIAGVAAVALAAAGLGWWFSTPNQTFFDNPEVRSAPAQAVRVATPVADPEQVRRAYEEFGLVYANSGADGLARFAESCAQSLEADGRILDFCLAFDMFASAVTEGGEPAGEAQARRVALVQTALPGADPDARIAEVQRLTRQASGLQVAATTPETAPAEASTSVAAPPAAEARPIRLAKAQATPPRKARAAGGACASRSTPADRLLCANPTLKVQERRMKEAYERALAAGADPLAIDRGQAEWRAVLSGADTRAELADLYARRTRELTEAAETAERTPPS